jgi:hypothetical protein
MRRLDDLLRTLFLHLCPKCQTRWVWHHKPRPTAEPTSPDIDRLNTESQVPFTAFDLAIIRRCRTCSKSAPTNNSIVVQPDQQGQW